MPIRRRLPFQFNTPKRVRHRPALISVALLLALFFAALLTQSANVSHAEAHHLWTVRDTVTVRPASLRDAARALLQNTRSTLQRTEGLPLYPLALDLWSFIGGDSVEMLRIFSALCVVIGAAAIMGADRRFVLFVVVLSPLLLLMARQLGEQALLFMLLALILRFLPRTLWSYGRYALLALIAAYLLLSIPALTAPIPDWQSAISLYRQARDPLHPVIVGFTTDSPLAYYDHQDTLREGVAVDLSWRAFTGEEVERVIERATQGNRPVWLIMPLNDAKAETVIAALEGRGYTGETVAEMDGIGFLRFE